jgi:hypothetical protein
VPLPAAALVRAAVQDGLGVGDVVGAVFELGAGDVAVIEVDFGPLLSRFRFVPSPVRALPQHLRPAPLIHLVLAGGLGHAPLPEHAREARQKNQHDPDQQTRRQRVPAAPAQELLRLAHPPRPDRPVLHEALEVLGHLGRRLVALGRLAGDRFEHHRLQVARHRRVELPGPWRLVVHDLLDEFAAVPLVERRPHRQQLIEGQPQGVQVAADVALAVEALGGHVTQRADDVSGVCQVVAIGFSLGQSEIGDPDVALPVDQQVGRLDVPVQHPLLPGVLKRLGDLDADPSHALPVLSARTGEGGRLGLPWQVRRRVAAGSDGRLGLRRRPGGECVRRVARLRAERSGPQALRDLGRRHILGVLRPVRRRQVGRAFRVPQPFQLGENFVEPKPRNELHHIEVQALMLADPENRHDVGVVQPRRRPRLALEAAQLPGVEQGVGRQHLEGDVPAQRDQFSLVDDPHAPAADLAQDLVIPELALGHRRRSSNGRPF